MTTRISGGELAELESAMEAIGQPSREGNFASVEVTCDVCAPDRYLNRECEWIEVPVMLDFDVRGRIILHRCHECRDSGRVRMVTDRHDPNFGKQFPCPSCKGGGPVSVTRVAESMLIPVAYRGKTFADWEDVGDQRMRVQKWLGDTWPPQKPILVLAGKQGAGKTHLACAAMVEVYEKYGTNSRFWNVGRLLDHYRATFDETAQETIAEIDTQLDRVPLLVLDEFGMHKNTEFAEERVFSLINRRYSEGKPLIVTTNKNPGELAEGDVRVYSRLMDANTSILVAFNLPDYRQRS